MQYDWTGGKMRRIRRIKTTMYLSGGLVAALSTIILHGVDLAPFIALVR
jgi:hypothetical protein